MKKIKNKFIIFILISVISVIFLGIFNSFFLEAKDKNSFAVLIEGKGLINEENLEINNKKQLLVGDVVKTIGNNSLIVIEWGDGSVTRLGGNSSVRIDELFVDKNLLKINLSFELLSGKSWSNVINFMGEDSYFKESFRDIEAGVRGTVFNVDLDNDYVSVIKHKLSLLGGDGSSFEITEAMPFSLKTFSFIELQEFIKNIKDKAFEDLNTKFDKEYLKNLTNTIKSKIESFDSLSEIDIKKLSSEKKQALYDEIMAKYQQLNFLTSDTNELFTKKLEYKSALITLAGKNDKIALIENTLYDFKDAISSRNYEKIEYIMPILEENLGTIKEFKINFSDYFGSYTIPEGLKETFARNITIFENMFGEGLLDKITNINFDYIKSVNEKVQDTIKKQLDKNYNLFTKIVNFVKEYFKK